MISLVKTDNERIAYNLSHYKNADYIFAIMLNDETRLGTAVIHHFGTGSSYMVNLAWFHIYPEHQHKMYGTNALNLLKERFGEIAIYAKGKVKKFYKLNGFVRQPKDCVYGLEKQWRFNTKGKYGSLMIHA